MNEYGYEITYLPWVVGMWTYSSQILMSRLISTRFIPKHQKIHMHFPDDVVAYILDFVVEIQPIHYVRYKSLEMT